VTCRQVLDFLVQKQSLVIPTDDLGRYLPKHFRSGYRAVQRWIKDCGGYQQGRRTGNLVPNQENVAKKHHYLRKLFSNRNLPPEEEEAEDEGDGSEDDSTDSDSDADEEADSESDEEAQLTQFVIHEI